MATIYTTGNWSIESLYVNSITTPKTLSLPDIDWRHDWHKAGKPAGRSVSNSVLEDYYGNTTGTTIDDVEHLLLQYQRVANVYDSSPLAVDNSNQLRQKNGSRLYRQLAALYKATNSVSGEEVYLPITGTWSLTVPASPLVQMIMVRDYLNRQISSMLDTGEVAYALIEEELRRDLDPTR